MPGRGKKIASKGKNESDGRAGQGDMSVCERNQQISENELETDGKKIASNGKNESDGWQSDKSVCERNRHMLENELETDVTFQVSSPQDAQQVARVRAHRYMLISASPVFWAMLCGELREEGDIVVRDVAPEAFREMLRFIYTDQVTINGHNVMQILYSAKKYQLSALIKRCVNFLDNELKASNACSILDHCHFFGEKELGKKCLDKIERNTEEALASDDFMTISSETLGVILDSAQLAIEEVELFEKTYEWASKSSYDAKSIRAALGDNLFKIRFPTMMSKEFTEIVCSKDVLDETEQLQILKYLTCPETSAKPEAFICVPRKGSLTKDNVNEEVKSDDVIRVGDRVRVTVTGTYYGGRLSPYAIGRKVCASEEGTVLSLDEGAWQNVRVKLSSGNQKTVIIPINNLKKISQSS